MAGSAFVWTEDSFVQDVSAGTWVHEGLSRFADGHRGTAVGDVVPPVFDAYARVFHPAHRRTGPAAGEVEPVTWGEVAEANGRTAHPLMEWDFITAAAASRRQGQPGLWDTCPATGNLGGPARASRRGDVVHLERPGGSQLREQYLVQPRSHPGLGPLPQPTPAGRSAAPDRLCWHITPCHVGAQNEHDAG